MAGENYTSFFPRLAHDDFEIAWRSFENVPFKAWPRSGHDGSTQIVATAEGAPPHHPQAGGKFDLLKCDAVFKNLIADLGQRLW